MGLAFNYLACAQTKFNHRADRTPHFRGSCVSETDPQLLLINLEKFDSVNSVKVTVSRGRLRKHPCTHREPTPWINTVNQHRLIKPSPLFTSIPALFAILDPRDVRSLSFFLSRVHRPHLGSISRSRGERFDNARWRLVQIRHRVRIYASPLGINARTNTISTVWICNFIFHGLYPSRVPFRCCLVAVATSASVVPSASRRRR